MFKSITCTLALLATLVCFGQARQYDLVVKNAGVFNSLTGSVVPRQTILIRDGRIKDGVVFKSQETSASK